MKRYMYTKEVQSIPVVVFDTIIDESFESADTIAAGSRTKSNNYVTVMLKQPDKFIKDFSQFAQQEGFDVLYSEHSNQSTSISCYFILHNPSNESISGIIFCVRTSDHEISVIDLAIKDQNSWLENKASELAILKNIKFDVVETIRIQVAASRNSYQQYLNRCKEDFKWIIKSYIDRKLL